MKTNAKVISVESTYAVVEVQRTSACDGCHKKEDGKECSVCSLVGGDRSFSARAENSLGAEVGDSVLVETDTGRVMWYAVLVFLLPLLASGVGLAVASVFGATPLIQTACAIAAFLIAFIGLFLYSKKLQNKQPDIKITEIVSKGGNVKDCADL
jgi:positive regulator of sigma E activity